MKLALLAVAISLCSCAALDRARAGAPDLVAPSGAGIYWHGLPADPAAVQMVERVHYAALAVCPAERLGALASIWTEVIINWQATDPFWCGRWVHGCAPLRSTVDVASSPLLVDELGHLIWQSCFDRSGESTGADGRVTYDADFAAWVAAVNSASPSTP